MVESSVGQRFLQLIQQLGMSKNAFAMSLDKTATVIQHLVDERNKPGFDLMCKVFEVYPNVSKDWLLLGQGPMLLSATPAPAVPATAPPVSLPNAVAPALAPPATPNFPAPLFAVSAARPAAPDSPPALPAEPLVAALPPAPPAASQPAPTPTPTPAPVVAAPLPASPLPAVIPAAPAAPPTALDAATLTAALHAQYLQHQLALAEQRNQHLLEQQALMQQMLDLLRRPV